MFTFVLIIMVIGIGGVSNSGKSYLAEKIREALPGKSVRILCLDHFVFPEEQQSKIENHIDWEIPESLDFDAFREAIEESEDVYDIVIAEGLMVFWNKKIDRLIDRHIFITLPEEVFKERKRHDMRWGKEPEWYISHIWDSYLKYGTLPEDTDDALVIDGTKEFNIPAVISWLNLY
ncbi:MAG: hypothetical protein Kow00127_04020 [Bacteroidales bacterium]